MNSPLNPRAALCPLPGWDAPDVEIQALPGGLSNRTFKVQRGDETLVLRMDGDRTLPFWIDREREVSVHRKAAQVGLAPDIVFANAAAGVLITQFVPGRTWSADDLRAHENIDHVTGLLRDVHALPLTGPRFESSKIAEAYLLRLIDIPDRADFAQRCVDVIAAVPAAGDICCCHNDVVAANLIGLSRPMLIDWEYACDNDPFFDLASLLAYHGVGKTLSESWLSAFAGGNSPELRERLAEQRSVYDALHWLWLAVRQSAYPSLDQERTLRNLQQSVA